MKLLALLLLLSLKVLAGVHAQAITLKVNNAKLTEVLAEIRKQTGFGLWYDDQLLKGSKPVSVQLNNIPLADALDKILENQPLTYSITDKTIVLKARPNNKTNALQSQSTYVSGKTVDEFGKPMQGVTIREKGVIDRTFISAKEGLFYVNVSSTESTLIFSYVGYETRELKASKLGGDLTNLTPVAMKPDVGKLDEVQVQAYGTTTKRLSTGNTFTISKEEIEKNPSRNVLEIIKNQVPGLFVDKKSSEPGNRISTIIRGAQVFGYSEPLLIVDGAQFPLGKLSLDLYQNQHKPGERLLSANMFSSDEPTGFANGLDFLDPSIIETIDVLKDAAATSIYGSRGAYGVIIITTKKGRSGNPRFNVNINTKLDIPGRLPEMLNTTQFLELQRETFRNSGTAITQQMPALNGTWPSTRYINWNDYFASQKPLNYNVNASYSGGFDNFTYYLAGNFQNDRTVNIGPGGTKRGGANMNLAFNQGGKFDLALSALYSSNADNSINIAPQYNLPPNAPDMILPDGSYNWNDYGGLKPYRNSMSALSQLFESKVNIFNTGLTLHYRPTRGIAVETRMSYNNTTARQLSAAPSTSNSPGASPSATTSSILTSGSKTITLDPNISYVSKLGYFGDLSVRAGFTLVNDFSYKTTVSGNQIISDAIIQNPTFTDPQNIRVDYQTQPARYLGYFGQLNYIWNQKYILDLTARYDGSTKFGPGKRFGLFGSVSGAWIMSAEPWFSKALPFVSFGKLRASWGTQGGDGIPNYQYVPLLAKWPAYLNQLTLFPQNLANPNLKWEKNTKSELGLDLNFLKGNLTTSFSYYRTNSGDQLQLLPLPTSTGFTSVAANIDATIRNTGLEAVIGTRIANDRSFSWNASLNFSIQRNKVIQLNNDLVNLLFNYELGRSVQGKRVTNFVGINPQNGSPLFQEGNGIISEDLRKSPVFDFSSATSLKIDRNKYSKWVDISPDFFGALNNRFSYKDFSLGLSISFTKRMVENVLMYGLDRISSSYNLSTLALDRWSHPGQVTGIPSLRQTNDGPALSSTDYSIEDGSVIRLQNVDISWKLPQNLISKLGLKNASLQLMGNNLFIIWTPYRGIDPDSQGYGTAPLRIFQGTVKLSF